MEETTFTASEPKPYEGPVDTCLGLLSGRHLGLSLVVSQESIPPFFGYVIGTVGHIAKIEHLSEPYKSPKVAVTDRDGGVIYGDPGTSCKLSRPADES